MAESERNPGGIARKVFFVLLALACALKAAKLYHDWNREPEAEYQQRMEQNLEALETQEQVRKTMEDFDKRRRQFDRRVGP